MKKYICIILSVILLFSFTSCKSDDVKYVSERDLSTHYNQCISDLDEYIENNDIDVYDSDANFDGVYSNGEGNIYYVLDNGETDVCIDLYRYVGLKEFIFGMEGYEKCQVQYSRDFSDITTILDNDKMALQLLPVALSSALGEELTEYDINLILTTIKAKVIYGEERYGLDDSGNYIISEYKYDYKGVSIAYYLYLTRQGGKLYNRELITFE